MRAGVLIAVAQTRRGRSAPLEVRKYQRGTRMTIVFPLLPLASRVGVWWALSCSSSLACLPASQPSHRRAVWTQPRATGLQGREESHVSPAPPVSVTLAAHYIKLTVATVYLRLRVAVTPKTGELCDGDAQNVYISFDLHKNVLFIRLLLGPWRRIRLSPLQRQCASCNEMRWQRQQQHSSFIAAINWYSWSRMKILHIAFGRKIVMKSVGPQKVRHHWWSQKLLSQEKRHCEHVNVQMLAFSSECRLRERQESEVWWLSLRIYWSAP